MNSLWPLYNTDFYKKKKEKKEEQSILLMFKMSEL